MRAARSNLGGAECIKADFRNLGEHLWQFSLPIELFLPYGSSCVPAQSSVQAVQRDVTNVSLRRIDRAYYPHRCDVHSDTSDDTCSPTRRDAKRSRQEPQEGVRTASRSSEHKVLLKSLSLSSDRRARIRPPRLGWHLLEQYLESSRSSNIIPILRELRHRPCRADEASPP